MLFNSLSTVAKAKAKEYNIPMNKKERNLLLIIGIIAMVGMLYISEIHTKKVMGINYCFQELADGSLYHYVCEE